MPSCITCGMPFEGSHINDIGLQTPDGPVCIHDSEQGHIKSATSIFEGGVTFFAQALTNGDRPLAERLTRTNMLSLPYWQTHPCAELEGPVVSDAEFATYMQKLM